MGVEIRLSDSDLPASPAFIQFLARALESRRWEQEIWADQRAETLMHADAAAEQQRSLEAAALVMQHETGREWVARAYELLYCLLTGHLEPLEELLSRYRFVVVIGIPRSGGSYLTAELYRSVGLEPESVPGTLAHDGFPEAGPFQLSPGLNSWTLSLRTMAEYLVMVDVFFGAQARPGERTLVPKKITKAPYAGDFFTSVLGADAQMILTVRHPVAACVSTYEKSGGLPRDGRFAVRSNIEGWCQRDLLHAGISPERLSGMDYFDAYLLYWELYHLRVCTSGLSAAGNLQVIGYDAATLQAVAQDYHRRGGLGRTALPFEVSSQARERHLPWMAAADAAIARVAGAWSRAGLRFPVEQLTACW